MKKITYEIPMRITVDVIEGEMKKEIQMSFRAWKHGIVARENLLIDKKGIRAGKNKVRDFGKEIFDRVREMAREDGILLD